MKNLFLALAFMLVGTFAFANNTTEIPTVTKAAAVELISTATSYKTAEDDAGCLLTITFEFEDGTTETYYIIVLGASCDEILN